MEDTLHYTRDRFICTPLVIPQHRWKTLCTTQETDSCVSHVTSRNVYTTCTKRDPQCVYYIYQKRPANMSCNSHLCVRHVCIQKTCIYMKRDWHIWKETDIHKKRPMYMEKMYMYETRPAYMKRDWHIWKETDIYEKRPMYMEKMYMYETRPAYKKRVHRVRKDAHMWKETYMYEKRPIYMTNIYEKRRTCMYCSSHLHIRKECIECAKIHICEKRATCMKKDLYIWPLYMKRVIHVCIAAVTCI